MTGSSGGGGVPAAVTQDWRRGEEQLYAAALGSPDGYARTVQLVGRTLQHLRAVAPDAGTLLAAAARGAALVPDLAEEGGRPERVDLERVAQAALALRHRELTAAQAALDRVRVLGAERERGGTWVVLSESGDPAGDPVRPYRRLEADARSGRALLVTTAPDEDLRGCVHAVEALHVDLASGALGEARATGVAATMHPDVGAREQQVDRVRGRPGTW